MNYRGHNFTGATGATSPSETGAGVEAGSGRLSEEVELELARAMVSGDGETAGGICAREYLRYVAEEEEHPDGGRALDLSSTFIDPVKSISRSLR